MLRGGAIEARAVRHVGLDDFDEIVSFAFFGERARKRTPDPGHDDFFNCPGTSSFGR